MTLIHIYSTTPTCKTKHISSTSLIGSGHYLEGKLVKDNENFTLTQNSYR